MIKLIKSYYQFACDNIGIIPLCNKRPERAPHIGNFVFPLCWRCTGIIIGIFSLFTILNIFDIELKNNALLFGISLFCLPGFIDVMLQRLKNKISTNPRRIVTGILAGFSVVAISHMITMFINFLIHN